MRKNQTYITKKQLDLTDRIDLAADMIYETIIFNEKIYLNIFIETLSKNNLVILYYH